MLRTLYYPSYCSWWCCPYLSQGKGQHILQDIRREVQSSGCRHSFPAFLVDQRTIPSIGNIIFKLKIIKRLLNQLVPDKTTGSDHIPARVLKECSAELESSLCHLFHLCFSHGVFHGQWKAATVIPTHKRESKADPSKYRPISLLCIISKVMESVVDKQLQTTCSWITYYLADNLDSDRVTAHVFFWPFSHRIETPPWTKERKHE